MRKEEREWVKGGDGGGEDEWFLEGEREEEGEGGCEKEGAGRVIGEEK